MLNKIVFTPDQVKLIINTLLEVPAKVSYEAIKMIEQETAAQAEALKQAQALKQSETTN